MKKTVSAIGVFVLLLGGSLAFAQMSGGMMKDQSGTMHHDKMGEHHGMMEHGQMMSGMMGNVEPDDRDDGKDVRHDERHAGRQHEEDVRHHERNVASDAGYVHDDGQWKVHSSRDEEDAGSNDGDTERNVWDGNAQIASDTADSLTQFEKSTPNAETKNTSYMGNRGICLEPVMKFAPR